MKTKQILVKTGHDNHDSDDGMPRGAYFTLSPNLTKLIKKAQKEVIRLKKSVNATSIAIFDYTPTLIQAVPLHELKEAEDKEEGNEGRQFTDALEHFDNGGEYKELYGDGLKQLEEINQTDENRPIGDAIRLNVSVDDFWWDGSIKHTELSWYTSRIPIKVI